MIMKYSLKIVLILTLMISFIGNSQTKVDVSLQKEVEHSIIQGLKWLYVQQEENGSWNNYPAITALVLSSFLRAHPNISTQDTIIDKGFNFLKRL